MSAIESCKIVEKQIVAFTGTWQWDMVFFITTAY